MSRSCVHVIVEGRVQGVGYREFLRLAAAWRGVAGWTRNRGDGSVEAVLCGAPEAVEALLGEMRRGPPLAHVMDLRMRAAEDEAGGAFRILPSVE